MNVDLQDQFRRARSRLSYQPESWSRERWERAYRSGSLDYFGAINEVARYAMLAGYVRLRPAGVSVLDVGCGDGRLADHLPASASYTGMDLSDAAIHRAQARTGPGRRFLCGDIMDEVRESADIVVLNEVLYFAPSPEAMLERAAALAGPGGWILVSMWRHPGDRHLWNLLQDRLRVRDQVSLRNAANRMARRGWRVGCFEVGE
jgi:2-polyprenyl-3-methyl-5-hydroxy-6-metoxy-1,4-benzoquinol methylase